LELWRRVPLRTTVFREGLQAIEWSVGERGLAGLADLEGLPWRMPMETFFEAWCETVARSLVQRIGGVVQTGREKQTLVPLSWDPPWSGSQRYLLPDVVLRRQDDVVVFDAKYKAHFEEISAHSWRDIEDQISESHRADLFQVLAYSSLFESPRVTCCLLYPCRRSTWDPLKKTGRTFHRASVAAGTRTVEVILAAIPMDGTADEAAKELTPAFAHPH